jgi:hypothetical protein
METVRALSVEIGPRPACSRAEQRAAEWCAARLSESGYRVDVEEFASRPNYALWYSVYLSLSAVGALLIVPLPFVAVVVGAVAFVVYARDADGRPVIKPRRAVSRNVVALPPTSEPPELIVMAHMDSARSSPSFHPRLVAGFRSSVLLLNGAMAAVPLLGAAVWIYEVERELPGTMWIPSGLVAGYLVFAAGLLLYGHFRMPLLAGANDNATGVAVLMRLAQSGPERGIWYVVTGSEEVGMIGVQAFFHSHAHEIAGARFLNIDNVGAGTLLALEAEGALRERRADGYLLDSAEEAGAEARPFRGLPTDATPLLSRRRKALTLLAVTDRGTPANWHLPTDVIDNVEPSVVDLATDVARHVVRSVVSAEVPG